MRALIPFALAFLLALTSQAMAVARGSADAAGQMVLCVGAETVIVYTDAEGAPTAAPHFCPDCALHMAFVALAPQLSAPQRITLAYQPQTAAAQYTPAPKGRLPYSRAPPFVV